MSFKINTDGILSKNTTPDVLHDEKIHTREKCYCRSRISYNDFLEKFEVRETEEGHKWLRSDHR